MSALPLRRLGHAKVPIPGLGCWGLSGGYTDHAPDETRKMTLLKAAYDRGCTFWDTADIYGDRFSGENEQLIGRALKEHNIPREDIFLATKFGFVKNADGTRSVHGEPSYVKSAIEKSLANLGVEYVDLYFLHRVDRHTPIEDTVRAMDELRQAGKVRHIGLSECSAETLRKAHKVAKIDALQVEYSLFENSVETNGLLDTCKELDIALVAFSPLV
eukprot:TRINITY_DN6412_c0_g1_i3.p1 TRINITY_DN6412_c0_g1~~TRINITY_DN6412_c0_g1_i3.p1  ORF type:complete len:227 (+),score=51.18 TRINITY_DN6412_c0_g1_i3:35-682(+)